MSITAFVENDTIRLPEGVHLPDGTSVEIIVPSQSAEISEATVAPVAKSPALAWMLEFAGSVDTLPVDFAEHHDDYRSGRRQR